VCGVFRTLAIRLRARNAAGAGTVLAFGRYLLVVTMKRLFERPAFLLVLGCAPIVAAHFRWGDKAWRST
jgi:hypothetical protein